MTDCCCFLRLYPNEQAVLTSVTGRELVDGPKTCSFFWCCFYSNVAKKTMVALKQNEQVLIQHEQDTKKNRYVFGPKLVKLEDPWEIYGFSGVEKCEILDQDDYIIVRSMDGNKNVVKGPYVWPKKYGDVVEKRNQSIQVPVNHYMIVNDTNNTDFPVQHIAGPVKYYLSAFQTVEENKNVGQNRAPTSSTTERRWNSRTSKWDEVRGAGVGALDSSNVAVSKWCFPNIEINQKTAIHLQLENSNVVLVSTPQYLMPKVGEKVVQYVDRIVLLTTDFCILKAPDGNIYVKNGKCQDDRSFFLKPFFEFVMFSCESRVAILSTLPTFMAHQFQVRTKDNVVLDLDLRICYQIQSVETFSASPIEEFYPNIKNHVQNKLLDRFATSTLREFMNTFAVIAQDSVEACSAYFIKYGIEILDVQILNFICKDKETQNLLNKDIETSVRKQNELRATQNNIAIQEQSNEVERRKKDLEVQMFTKDNDVQMEKKQLENTIRIKEMEVEIKEENKRTELLEVKRGNDLVEAEFAGKAKGHEFNEFVKGIDANLSAQQKLTIWKRQLELEQAEQVYSKMGVLNMMPPEEDMSLFNFGTGENRVVEIPETKAIVNRK